MSQSRKKRSAGSSASRKRATPAPVREPVREPVGRRAKPVERSSFREQIDQRLPPFSTRRYLAIWLLGMIPLVLVLLLLLRPWAASDRAGQAINGTSGNLSSAEPGGTTLSAGSIVTQTPTGEAFGNGDATPEAPAGAGASGTAAPADTAAAGSGATGEAGAGARGKYLVIDTSKGRIVAQLHTDPSAGVRNTIANFEQKAGSGYFNGLTFHRVEDWVIQGGDPTGTGTGGGDMPSEYNQLPFKAGSLGIARGQDPAINNDSQFFITKTDADWLNGQYTNWGQVVEGMEVVNAIAIGDKINSVRVEER